MLGDGFLVAWFILAIVLLVLLMGLSRTLSDIREQMRQLAELKREELADAAWRDERRRNES